MQIERQIENAWRELIARLRDDESGQDLIEYVLIAGAIAVGAVGTMSDLAQQVEIALQKLAVANF